MSTLPSKPIQKFDEKLSAVSATPDLTDGGTPLQQGKVGEKKNLYTLFYRAGNNPHAMSKHFFLSGELRDVVTRAKKHCDTLGYRFVRIEPFISDLAADERKHTGASDDGL